MTLEEITSLATKEMSLKLIGRCGKGAFGVVYLATDQLGRSVALKIVDKERLGKNWEREFKGISNYCQQIRDHGNLIEIYHVKEYPDFFCYTMEAADNFNKGGEGDEGYCADTLEKRLDNGMQFGIDDMMCIAEELLSGLEILHKAGLIHRDIKPSNVIFVNGHAKLGDMGLLTRFSDSQSFAGTAEYLPPEFTRQGSDSPKNNTEGDLYALGKVLYCILSGLPPSSFPEIPSSILGGKEIFRLNKFLLKACSDDKSRRFASINSFRNALRNCCRRDHARTWILLVVCVLLAIAMPVLFASLRARQPAEHAANGASSSKAPTPITEERGQKPGAETLQKSEEKAPEKNNAAERQLPLFADEKWQPPPNANWTNEWNAALAKARREKKAIYVLSTGSDWCSWCKKLRNEVLDKQGFLDFASSQLVLLYLDAPRKNKLCREQAIHNDFIRRALSFEGGVPNAKVLSPDGEIYGTIAGGNKTLLQYRDALQSLLLTKPNPLDKRTEALFSSGYSPQLASDDIRDNEAEVNLKKAFKAEITGIAISELRKKEYGELDFKPVSEHIRVPYGHILVIRVQYDFPDKYSGFIWTRTEMRIPGMGSNPSNFYKGKGIAYGFLMRPAQDCHLDKIVVRTNSSPRIGNGRDWIISSQNVNIDMDGKK